VKDFAGVFRLENKLTKTEDAFSEGLEDVVAAESSICKIDGKNSKLSYRGYDIHDLTEKSTYEETAYLLLFGKLPNKAQYAEFRKKLAETRELPEEILGWLGLFPTKSHPMAVLRSVVSLLSLFDPEAEDKAMEPNVRKAIRLIARTPTVIATFERMRRGLERVAPKMDLESSLASNFLYMMKGAEASGVEASMLDKYLILLAEHDLNASTFAARTTASTTSDIYSAMSAAVGTLKGDLHGSANSRAMESILAVGDVSRVNAYVEDALNNKRKLMGFGHRVYKGPDPRATELRAMAKTLAQVNPQQAKWYAISEALEKGVWEKKKLNCNVDFYSASVLYTLGFPVDLFTTVFAASRMSGWTAHVLEQYANNRLMRPVSLYAGPLSQTYIPIQNRS
jgi:citrate synthase